MSSFFSSTRFTEFSATLPSSRFPTIPNSREHTTTAVTSPSLPICADQCNLDSKSKLHRHVWLLIWTGGGVFVLLLLTIIALLSVS